MINKDKPWWRWLIKVLLFVGIKTVVQTFWATMEVAAYGALQPRTVDTIIGLLLAASLYCNLHHHIKIGDILI